MINSQDNIDRSSQQTMTLSLISCSVLTKLMHSKFKILILHNPLGIGIKKITHL